jgi:quinoprotein glucose dehydrogenase
VALVKNYTIGPLFTPPTMAVAGGNRGTLHAPGSNGGTDWQGGCYDPDSHFVYVFSQTALATLGVIKNEDLDVSDFAYVQGQPGQHIRPTQPMGAPRPAGAPARGAPRPNNASAAPVGLTPVANTGHVLAQAARPAPAAGGDGEGGGPGATVQGLPLLKPPYGRISAIDLTKGTIAWQVAHGETPDNIKNHPALRGLTIPRTGRPGLVGPLCTKSLVICGEGGFVITPSGARGAMLRAYDKATGQEKGAVYTPAPSVGAPMTYMLGGEQYLLIGTGGGATSEELIAFRLPRA